MDRSYGEKVAALSDRDLCEELHNARYLAMSVFRNDEGVPNDNIRRVFFKRLRQLENEFARRVFQRAGLGPSLRDFVVV